MIATFATFSGVEGFPPSSSNQGNSPTSGSSYGPTVTQPASPQPRISFKDLHGPWSTPPLVCSYCLTLMGWMQDHCPEVLGMRGDVTCPECYSKVMKEAGL